MVLRISLTSFSPELVPDGQIDLGDITGDDCLGAETQAGEKHHHLFGSGILGLVQDDEGVVQGTAAHEGQGRHLNHTPLHELGSLVKVHHVMQGVIEGPQIGVDFFKEIAGQKAQFLAGFHRRPGQDDAAAFVVDQGGHGHGHGQIGFAGAGRTDAEDHVEIADCLEIVFLIEAFGGDAALEGRDKNSIQEYGFEIGIRVLPDDPQGILHVLTGNGVAGLEEIVQFFQGPGCQLQGRFGPFQDNFVAPDIGLDLQKTVNNPQMLVLLAEQGLHQVIIGKGEFPMLGTAGSHWAFSHAADDVIPMIWPRMVRFRGRLSKSNSTICCQVPRVNRLLSTGIERSGLNNAARTWE